MSLNNDEWKGIHLNQFIRFENIPAPLTVKDSDHQYEHNMIKIGKEGNETFYISHQINLMDENEKSAGQITVLHDVTGFKKLDKLKSDFLTTISHELKTPLTAINMTIDILLREIRGKLTRQQKELLQGAKEDSNRMKNFLLQLLDLTKLESGVFNFKMQKIAVKNLIEQAVKPLQLKIEEKLISIKMIISDKLIYIPGDESQLERVLINLIENAIRHTPGKGVVTISAKPVNDNAEFSVEDTGEGIPGDALEFIFDKFVQVKKFEHTEKGTIGLGLAICKEIIHAHKGEIKVSSTPGKGSCFKFYIPLEQSYLRENHA
jgi:signal transduction histidine kinase